MQNEELRMSLVKWWQDAVGYQIYPRSFADGNGDGIGDIPGIIDKLDYLQHLGITALWISPFYPSPQFDCGYDVADYTDINPEYGTMADFDRLLEAAHQRGIRLILDLVLNHTSDQHPWFIQSKSSRDNPYRDWYVWRDGVNGGPPNDWESGFGGSAWQYDENTGQYYYHYFFPEQPDLNWRNPVVIEGLFKAVRFWLDKGVDGFRLDAIGTIMEDEAMLDNGVEISLEGIFLNQILGTGEAFWDVFLEKMRYQIDLPENHDIMQALRRVIDEYPNRILLGETEDVRYYSNGQNELHSVFNFDVLNRAKFDAAQIRKVLTERLPLIPSGGWESNTVGNHDRTRSMTLYADGKDDLARAKVALAMTTFLRGTPMFYNGEEIGMTDLPMKEIADFRDNLGVWVYHALQERKGLSTEEALKIANTIGRDKCRTPMQWSNTANGGFSPAGMTTWLPVNPNYAQGINVADQQNDLNSLFNYLRQLIQVRQSQAVLRHGDFELLDSGEVLAFWRHTPEQSCLVALNMSAEAVTLNIGTGTASTIFSSHQQAGNSDLAALKLAPYEVYVGLKQ